MAQATQTAQITCITENDRYNEYERITLVGVTSGGGWRITQEDAISDIEQGTWSFFVSVRGDGVWVEVARSRFGNKYLKTEADGDGDRPNNLLSLPDCRP